MAERVDALRAAVMRHHVHFEVEPELAPDGGARLNVGLLVRLWGVHEKGMRALPGCRRSLEIAARLSDIARYVVEDVRCAELEPFRGALYDSRVVPGSDEVALAIRIVERTPHRTGHATAAEVRCLGHVRARLRALGAREQ